MRINGVPFDHGDAEWTADVVVTTDREDGIDVLTVYNERGVTQELTPQADQLAAIEEWARAEASERAEAAEEAARYRDNPRY